MSAHDESTHDYHGTRTGQPPISLLIYHRDGAQIVALDDTNKVIVIGRAPPSQVQLDDDSLSRQHARFTLIFGEVWLEDLNSTNGTSVNGQPIEKVRVSSGDEVTMGAVTLTVHQPERSETQTHAGLDSHDELTRGLEHEVVRARSFSRGLALMMIRGNASITQWLPQVQRKLRAVDRMAAYSPDMLEVMLPEISTDEAAALASDLSRAVHPPLRVGVAYFPASAASAGELIETARRAALRASRREPVNFGRGFAGVEARESDAPVIHSAAMKNVYETVRRVGRSPLPVLVFGETGTGKELVARAIHRSSPRGKGPLRCINSAAIPAQLLESALFGHERGAFTGADRRQTGVFEEANGGTVFLDEIGELSPAAQAALLRVLETKQLTRVGSHDVIDVDVRLVAATHRDLEAMCADGSFREDLLYRLNAVTINVPPLRDRAEEVGPLAEYFLGESATMSESPTRGIAPEALEVLQAYAWPGNVRELRNAIERAAVISVGDVITVEDLPERIREAGPAVSHAPQSEQLEASFDLRGQVRNLEIQLIRRALNETGWNQTEAAGLLGIPRRTLVRRLREYGIRRSK